MISAGQIDEWLREIEARPESAAAIVRIIASRLRELDEQNQALLAENILLRSGKKVEGYENQIAALNDQLELLKRQFSGVQPAQPADNSLRLIICNPIGQVLCLPLPPEKLEAGQALGRLTGELSLEEAPFLQVVNSPDELLFVLDSGRVIKQMASALPAAQGNMDWSQAVQIERRGSERLAFVLSIGRLPLYEFGVQVSRRAFVRLVQSATLSGWINKGNVGTGVLLPSDRTFSMRLAQKDQRIVIASREGLLWSMAVRDLPYMPEEALRLSTTDRIVDIFVADEQTDLLVLTQSGKVFHRELAWLDAAHSFKSPGQAVLSNARLEAGVRVAAAAAVNAADWTIILTSDGLLSLHRAADLLNAGSVLDAESGLSVAAFCVFQA